MNYGTPKVGVESYIEAVDTKFGYLKAFKEVLTFQDRFNNYEWSENEEEIVLSELTESLEDVVEEKGHEIDIDYKPETGSETFESVDGKVKVGITYSEKFFNPGEESELEELYPGVHIMMEVPEEFEDVYREDLEEITSSFERRFV